MITIIKDLYNEALEKGKGSMIIMNYAKNISIKNMTSNG